jgi:hypothetical protein
MHCLFLFIPVSLLTICANTSMSYQTYYFLQKNSELIFDIFISNYLCYSSGFRVFFSTLLFAFSYQMFLFSLFSAFFCVFIMFLCFLCLCALFIIDQYTLNWIELMEILGIRKIDIVPINLILSRVHVTIVEVYN